MNDLFTQDDVNYLFYLTRNSGIIFEDGEKLVYNPRVRTVIQEIWVYLLRMLDQRTEEATLRLMEATKYFEVNNSFNFWQQLMKIIMKRYDVEIYYELILQKIFQTAPFAEKPDYLIKNSFTNSYLKSMIRKETKNNSDSIDTINANQYLTNIVTRIQTRMEYVSSKILFQVLGPCHRRVNNDLLGDDICSRYGGCRMLTCNCLYYDPDSSESTTEWFAGYCEHCYKLIDNKRHAVRKPGEFGGWLGAYCSIGCVWNEIFVDPNLLTVEIWKTIVQQIYKNGIFL